MVAKTMALVCGLVTFGAVIAHSAERDGVKLPDTVTVDGRTLQLNCRPVLRKVTKFGIPVKVYVGALYVEKKSTDSEALVKSDELKQFIMHYVRSVDKDPILEGFLDAYDQTCVVNCDKKKEQLREFRDALTDIRQGHEILLTFRKDSLEVETTGPKAKKTLIQNADLSRNMMAVYVGPKTLAGSEFRKDNLCL